MTRTEAAMSIARLMDERGQLLSRTTSARMTRCGLCSTPRLQAGPR